MDSYDVDREMMGDFVDESLDALSVIPGLFVEFEDNPENLKILEAIFRPIHSLKGNAAYFGLMKTKALAHELESVLDHLRKGKLLPSREIVDVLLAGVDEIVTGLERTRDGAIDSYEEQNYQGILARVSQILNAGEGNEGETQIWKRVFEDLSVLQKLNRLGRQPQATRLIQVIQTLESLAPEDFRGLLAEEAVPVAIEGGLPAIMRQFLEKPPENMSLEKQAEEVRSFLDALAATAENESVRKEIVAGIEEFHIFVDRIGFDPMLRDSLVDLSRKLETMQNWTPEIVEEEVGVLQQSHQDEQLKSFSGLELDKSQGLSLTETYADPGDSGARKEKSRTMRVSEERIDAFLGFVGELIAIDEMFRYIHGQMVKHHSEDLLTTDLLRVINTFTKLSDDLQTSIMEIRKVSVKPLLTKAQRIVRDVAAGSGKDIQAKVEGEETAVDRSLLDTLEVPLLHMVRNAADHGIEMPEARRNTGKSDKGLIQVNIYETEDDIIMLVSDDGKGLDYEKIRQKAVKNGLIEEGDAVSNDLLVDFIFSSGFSTAEKVTDVSGRGVGMDAVKRTVEEAGGAIAVSSKPGEGTDFHIRLPKSVGTQILNSFVVRVNNERVVVPMDKISGSFRPDPASLHRYPNGNACVRRGERVYPIIGLNGPYSGKLSALSKGILITFESKQKPFTFFVDTILGLQKVVLRRVPGIVVEKFSGAAVMGDGRVSMIVNVAALEKMAAGEEDLPRASAS